MPSAPAHPRSHDGFIFGRLAARDGVLVVHTSARYSKFFPVVDATARSTGVRSADWE